MTNIFQNWNLDTLYPSSDLADALHHIKHKVFHFKREFKQLADIKIGILDFESIEAHCQDLQCLIECLLSQNVDDTEALKLHGQIVQIKADCDSLGEEISKLLAEFDEETFETLLQDPDIHPIAFHLKEKREWIKKKLPVEQEKLACRLAIDGYQGWNEMYDTLVGNMRIPSPFLNESPLSVGQAENRLQDQDRTTRQAWFHRWEETWANHEDLIAQILNHIGGFRLNLYGARKWPSILQEPLHCNRMKEKTLQTMWEVIDKHKGLLENYLNCKAKHLGLKQLAWYDIEAPLPFASQTSIPFEEAAHFIIKHFTEFSPSMGEFAKLAFREKWIEAEDRPRKRPGGYCAPFLHAGQSRIFMTYSGTMANVFTLAHELGHGYHSYVMRGLPFFAQQYRMNVAETASTLAEMVTIDSMIHHSHDEKIQLALLDNQLQRSVIFMMNIHSRFLFEIDFYEERKKGFVLAKDLNSLMENGQKRAFGNILSEWYPHFWASKQHFYSTDVPFYNFPYSFGYLFSLGIYAHLKDQKEREETYACLLRDSGSLDVEELASRHLHVYLNHPDFWEKGLSAIQTNVKKYLDISSKHLDIPPTSMLFD